MSKRIVFLLIIIFLGLAKIFNHQDTATQADNNEVSPIKQGSFMDRWNKTRQAEKEVREKKWEEAQEKLKAKEAEK